MKKTKHISVQVQNTLSTYIGVTEAVKNRLTISAKPQRIFGCVLSEDWWIAMWTFRCDDIENEKWKDMRFAMQVYRWFICLMIMPSWPVMDSGSWMKSGHVQQWYDEIGDELYDFSVGIWYNLKSWLINPSAWNYMCTIIMLINWLRIYRFEVNIYLLLKWMYTFFCVIVVDVWPVLWVILTNNHHRAKVNAKSKAKFNLRLMFVFMQGWCCIFMKIFWNFLLSIEISIF